MARSLLKPALIAAVVIPFGAMTAGAQFESIFGNPGPRPPASVPGGRQQIPAPPPQPQSAPSSLPNYGGPAPGAIQSQPLPPPGGDPRAPAGPPSQANQAPGVPPPAGQAPLAGLPPGQRQPRGTPQPADTSPQPGDEVIAEPPSQKIPNTSALFSGLDKITGRIINFDAAIGETVQFGALQVTPRACYTRPATETSNTDAFVEVDEVTLQGEVRRIFTGWVFAASPGLHAIEHPIYDVWLTDCKGGAQTVAAEKPAEPPAAPVQRTQQRPPQQPPQPQQPQPPQQQRRTAPPSPSFGPPQFR
jgi:hypothetical protein